MKYHSEYVFCEYTVQHVLYTEDAYSAGNFLATSLALTTTAETQLNVQGTRQYQTLGAPAAKQVK